MRAKLKIGVFVLGALTLSFVIFTVFFDQAVIVRKGTIYHAPLADKVVALTFDDGPSPKWTPLILDELKKAGVKATFFMLGEHVAKYPDVARRVAEEGHEIENHTYTHHVLIYYKDYELVKEVKDAESIIRDVTGITTRYFRPPKAWLTDQEKIQLQEMGYKVVLWSLNSKDWVTFDDKYMIKYILHHVRPGDIILFHDSGGTFSTEGGDRHETVLAISRVIERLRERGYRFVTVSELVNYK
jgi:peptidoglycan/xylan/chitin deacetylase (PgdA/CDA1 family)